MTDKIIAQIETFEGRCGKVTLACRDGSYDTKYISKTELNQLYLFLERTVKDTPFETEIREPVIYAN